jgi:hypothetical protein
MNWRVVKVILSILILMVLGYLLFRVLFYDNYEVGAVPEDIKARLAMSVDDHMIYTKCDERGISVTFLDYSHVISNGFDEFKSEYVPFITFIDTANLVFASGPWDMRAGLKVFVMPTYSELRILDINTMHEKKLFRLPGVVENAFLADDNIYFRLKDGTVGRF